MVRTLPPAGEVMSANICEFLVRTWGDDGVRPGFGSFLKATSQEHNIEIFGVVYDVLTGPIDNQHAPVPLKLTREQLKSDQPQIFSLLKTELKVATCGFANADKIWSRLPPHPPSVHDFVYPLRNAEVQKLTSSLEFLRLVAWVKSVPTEELVAASLRQAAEAHENPYEFLVGAGRNLSCIFRDDYERLLSVLRNIKPEVTQP